MTRFNTRTLSTFGLLGCSVHASAHEANGSTTFFHYLTSPDHVAIFGVVVLVSIATYGYLKSTRLRKVKADKR